MAINVDISKITGINQVGNSYQRKSAVPLDYYSLFNTKAEAEAYAASNPVSYVGQVISYIDNNEVKVCYIADAAGTLKQVGTAPSGDNKTIEVSAEGAVALLGGKDAANGTLPMIGEDGKLTWKTLEQIGAGDGNDNTTYEFSFAEQKITIKPLFNGQPIKVKDEEGNDTEEIVTEVLDLSAFVTADELTEALNALPEDENTTYELTQEGMVLTLTPSEGDAQTVTIDAYSKSEIDDKFAALPEDEDTTYSVKEGEKALKLEGTEFSTVLGLTYANNRISLTGINNEEIAGFDASAFVEDGVLQDVSYDAEARELTFTWNIIVSAEGEDIVYKTDVVSIADLVDTYAAGHGLDLTGNEFSIKLAEGCEGFLSVDENGLKLAGVQDAIDEAKQAAIDAAAEAAKIYESKADASSVYTKEEANALLADKADADSVYTKGEADELLSAKANAADVERDYAKKATTLAGYGITDAYTAAQTDAAILAKIGEMTGGESAADVLGLLNAYKAANDREVWGDEFVTNHTADGKYVPTYTGNSRIDAIEAKVNGVEAGAQVNVIESVSKKDNDCRIVVETNGKAVTIDDANLRTDISNAKQAGIDAGVVASRAEAAASQNAAAIQEHGTKIGGLDTLTKEHTTKIANLELADSTHAGEFEALSGTVATHGSDIAGLKSGKADTTVTDALSGRITANENAIKTLNDTTIPGINGEIAKKADADKVYTKSEIGAIEADKTLVQMIADAKSEATYDDAEVRGLIANNADAIAAIYKVDGETKTGVLATEIARVEGLVSTEVSRAQGAESALADRLDTVEAFWKEAIRDGDEKNVIDTLKEIQEYIESDESGAAAMAASIKSNSDAIAAIYNVAEDGTKSGTLVTEIARVDSAIAAINDASTGILANAKAHTDASIAALLVKDVDNKTIKLNEGKAYVAEVSTDLLVQGTAELHLIAGNASV